MAFPTVIDFNGQNFVGNNQVHLVDMPATVNAGELLVVLFSNDGGDSCTTPAGWTRIGSEGGTLVEMNTFVKIADGSEGGTTVDFNTPGGGEEAASHTYLYDTWHGTTLPETTRTAGAGGAPDPGLLAPSWGSADTAWLGVAARNNRLGISAGPAGYTNFVRTESSNTTSSCEIASARLDNADASENPGVFTVTSTEEWIAFTLGVRPAAAGSSPNVNPTGSALQTLASGTPTIPPDDTETVTPVGSTTGTLISDEPVIQIANPGESVAPVGTAFSTLASDVPFIEITLPPVESSPTGSTTSALEQNETADIRSPVQLLLTGATDGDAFFPLEFGFPSITGVESDVTLRFDFAGSSLFALQSGNVSITNNVSGDGSVAPQGSTFLLLQPQTAIPPETEPTEDDPIFDIDTDATLNAIGCPFSPMDSGAPVLQSLQTGVTGVPIGSTFGLLASGPSKISQSHPTAPPSSIGGRLILRSITFNITRPVVLSTELQLTIASG